MNLEILSKKGLEFLLSFIQDERIQDEIRTELLSRNENEKIKCYCDDSKCTKPECGCDCEESKCKCEKENVDNYKYYFYLQELDPVSNNLYGLTICKTDGTYIKYKNVCLELTTKTLSNYTEFESDSFLNCIKIKDEHFKNFIETSKEEFDIADEFLSRKLLYINDDTLSKLKDLFFKDKKVIYPKGTLLFAIQREISSNFNDETNAVVIVRLLEDVYELNKLYKCKGISVRLTTHNGEITNVRQNYYDQEFYKIDKSFVKLNTETSDLLTHFLNLKE